MTQLQLSNDLQGRLYADRFDVVILPEETDTMGEGSSVGIVIGKTLVGHADILKTTLFPFKNLNDALSYRMTGKPAHFMAAVLKQKYEKNGFLFTPETQLAHIIFEWTIRDIDNTNYYIREFWLDRKDIAQQPFSRKNKYNDSL
ncbi:MAG TPA: hypothetical protein PKY29_04325 [Ferruginibacter sp.]|nr:hypothetical protein [Ferruginibacter sp.]HRQ20514.1 hypothetical protein [Ferruginibacter sp.]